MRALVLAALLGSAALAAVLAPAGPALGQEKGRVDLFGARSERKGYGTVEPGFNQGGRVELYDEKSRRLGYGKVREDGRLELFDKKSRRVGEGVRAR